MVWSKKKCSCVCGPDNFWSRLQSTRKSESKES
ncbi:hypothetical protein DD587_31690 [Klebsiella pneumoniae]|nr:hypothetical protein DD587_31690 [Klebsiella pneumoniae]